MPLTQDNINQALDQVVNNFTNKHIAMPNGKYQNECTAPVTWYLQWLGLPWDIGMHNNRADGWGVSPPYQLTPFFSFENFNPNRGYPRGTILMWDSPHIAIVLADSPGDNTVVCFEQNADPDGSACGSHTRILSNHFHTCTHAMVPIIEVPVSAPAAPPYTITQVDPYKRDVLAGHQKWDLNQPNFDAVANNPILTLNQQTTITVAAELHHHHPTLQQYTYLLEDPNVPQGYNFKDTVAYVPPAPAYVPPAAPVPVKLAPKVELVTEVPYYENSTNAKTAYKPSETKLPAGEYILISTDFGMWNLSSDNMKDLQHWVNPKDNVNPPLPTPVAVPAIDIEPTTGSDADTAWKQDYRAYPVKEMYLSLREYEVTDIAGSRPNMPLPRYDAAAPVPADGKIPGRVAVYGTFPGPDRIRYYRLRDERDKAFTGWYGVPILDYNGLPILRKEPTIRPATAAPVKQKASNKDTIHLITSHIEEGIPKFIDILPRWYKQINKQKGNK